MERSNRIQRTMRATQPVCSIRVSRRLAKRSDARQEIVFPQKKYFLRLRNNRSTRIQEGQTNQPDARNLCAASHDTGVVLAPCPTCGTARAPSMLNQCKPSTKPQNSLFLRCGRNELSFAGYGNASPGRTFCLRSNA